MSRVIISLLLLWLTVACPEGCSACTPDNRCRACGDGYEITLGGRCVQGIVPNCAVYHNQNECHQCQATHSILEGFCLKEYSGCLAKVGEECRNCMYGQPIGEGCSMGLNCEEVDQSGKCSRCVDGFTLQGQICVDTSVGCVFNDPSNGVCIMCDFGFKLVGYQCLSDQITVPNCDVYTAESHCKQCKYGYEINEEHQCVIPSNSICVEFDEGGNCRECVVPTMTLLNGVCVDAYCQVGAPGNCTVCKTGYRFSSAGYCEIDDSQCSVVSTFNPTRCDQCKPGYFVTINGNCQLLPENCIAADIESFRCIQCVTGFRLSRGNCMPPIRIANCQLVNQLSGQCQVCNPGYYLLSNTCQKVSSLCRTYDLNTGACFDCKVGYTNIGGQCKDPNCLRQRSQNTDQCQECKTNFRNDSSSGLCKFYDQNCAILTFLGCNRCKEGFYRDTLCKPYPKFCVSGDASGQCLQCQAGFSILNNQCVVIVPNCFSYAYTDTTSYCQQCNDNHHMVLGQCVALTVRDPNCIKIQNDQCLECARMFYFSQGQCLPVNPNCKDYNRQNGDCTDCYTGYSLRQGRCTASNDPNCKTFADGKCLECYSGFVVDQDTYVCRSIDPLCRSSDRVTGQCQSCFQGYQLFQGRCVVMNQDPNCIRFDSNFQCTRCSSRFILVDGFCTRINPLCKTFDPSNGDCLSCYPGYYESGGDCMVGIDPNQDPNCRYRSPQGACIQCFSNYYLSMSGQCRMVNVLCRTIDITNGFCTGCYPGYLLQGGSCVIATASNSDPNCVKFGRIGQCQNCYAGFFVKEGICTKINSLCNTYNSTNGYCLSCYPGYELDQFGGCVIPQTFTLAVEDPYCVNRAGTTCLDCSAGYFVSSLGACQQVNPLCKDFDRSNGDCLSCYLGYRLLGGQCLIQQDASLPFCLVARGSICEQCMSGYYAENPYTCTPVSILCSTYDRNTGHCLSCITGYFLQQGSCVFPAMGFDANCMSYDTSAFCSSCKPGYYLLNYLCAQIDPFCVDFDEEQNECRQCGAGRQPSGARCR